MDDRIGKIVKHINNSVNGVRKIIVGTDLASFL
jgi:hypothetical protein